MEHFRIYKTVIGKPRKNGGRLVKSYGCNGKQHVVTYDLIWYDEKGFAINGQADIKPKEIIGKCDFSKTCRNLGFFVMNNMEVHRFEEKKGVCGRCGVKCDANSISCTKCEKDIENGDCVI